MNAGSRLQAYAMLVEGLTVPASLHDTNGVFVSINAGAEKASGLTRAHWVGRHFLEPVPPDARRHVEGQFMRAIETGEPTHFETPFVDAGGHLRWTRAQHLPLSEDGEIIGVLILAWDAREPAYETVSPGLRPQLTPRQREILDLIAAGRSTEEIARELTLAPDTVRNHLRNLLRELDAHSRVEAVANAQRLGLLAARPLRPQQES
jgi:PAS domain S-box-containing protein